MGQIISQEKVLDAQVKDKKITAQQVIILQKMGLVNPSREADIDYDVLAFAKGGNKDAEAEVVRKVGLKNAVDFGNKMNDPKNAAVKSLVDRHSVEFSKGESKFDPFLKAMGDRVKTDPSIVDKLGAQLKDKKTAARFEKDLVEHPKEMASLISKYTPETLGASLAAIDHGPSVLDVVVAQKADKTNGTPTDTKKGLNNKPSVAKHEDVSSSKVSVTVASNAETIAPLEVVGSPGVVLIAEEIGKSVEKNFPNLKDDVPGFVDYIKSKPESQKKIKEQLDKHPEIQKMLNEMDTKNGEPLDDSVRKTLSPFMKKFLNNPQKLETDEGMQETLASFRKDKGKAATNAMTDWIKDKLGFDVSGMMSGLGGMLEQAMSYIGKFVKAIGHNLMYQNSEGNSPLSGKLMFSQKGYNQEMGNDMPVTAHAVDQKTGHVQTHTLDPNTGGFQNPKLAGLQNNPTNDRDREYKGPVSPNYSAT